MSSRVTPTTGFNVSVASKDSRSMSVPSSVSHGDYMHRLVEPRNDPYASGRGSGLPLCMSVGIINAGCGSDLLISIWRSLPHVVRIIVIAHLTLPLAAGAAPKMALIIDDLGYNLARAERVVALPGPVTIAVLPFTAQARPVAEYASAHGADV